MGKRIIIDELEFEVPYGKLAAKTYHEETEDCKRVLAIHGWMDNSGSFDHVMPLIKHEKGLYIVCVELPGHGKSSQLPPGAVYNDLGMVLEIRRCMRELNWCKELASPSNGNLSSGANNNQENHRKFTIIGHSWGGGLAILYASLFPEDVEEVVSIDFFKTRTIPAEKLLQETAANMDQFIDIVPSINPKSQNDFGGSKPPSPRVRGPDRGQVVVSQETAIVATIEGHIPIGSISRDDALCLLKRSTVPVNTPPNSVLYSRDLRLQSMPIIRDHFEVNKIMLTSRVNCHILFLLTKHGLYSQDEFTDNFDTMLEMYKSKTKSCHVQWMDADHYIHMTHSKKTAQIINDYLAAPTEFKVFKDY